MGWKYLLFDLDGTLTDSSEGIVNCVIYALKAADMEIPDRETLLQFIGPPLIEGFQDITGMDHAGAVKAAAKYRERYGVIGLFENKPYRGIALALSCLKNQGKVIALATSKPEPYAVRILQHFHLMKYFDVTVGASMDGTRNNKTAVIREVFRRLGLSEKDKKDMIMIGDRRHDIQGAKDCGIDSLGVYYGFAKTGELERAGADHIARSVEEVVKILGAQEQPMKSTSPAQVELLQEEHRLVGEYEKLLDSAGFLWDGQTIGMAELNRYQTDPDREIRRKAWSCLQDFMAENSTRLDDLYDRLVINRTQQAKRAGCQNYTELGYCRKPGNCYDSGQIGQFRKWIKEYWVVLASGYQDRRCRRLGLEKLHIIDNGLYYKEGNPAPKGTAEDILYNGLEMYQELLPETAGLMDEDAEEFRRIQLEDAICFIPYGCMVDEFQQIIYGYPELSKEQRHEVWHRLEKQYRPHLDMDGMEYFQKGGFWQRQHQIYASPFYYIDYCLAQICALQYMVMQQDDQRIRKSSLKLCEMPTGGDFTDMLQEAGLRNPLEKETIIYLTEQLCDNNRERISL